MASSEHVDILSYLTEIEDPRIDRRKLYPLHEILLIVFCGTICGVESWRDFVEFGECKQEYLRRLSPYSNGIPSKNTFNRVMSTLDPKVFKDCFTRWISVVQKELGDVIAIDGKVLRHSFDKVEGQSAIHMISAFASNTRLVLGQEKVDEKSNEITAIPGLLELLDLNGAIVTIDAMGCQKDIAKAIDDKNGHYVLALKGNQGKLHNQVKKHFNNFFDMKNNKKTDHFESTEKNRGRIETRECLATSSIAWLEGHADWPGLKSLVAIKSQRLVDGKNTIEYRYYITSLEANAEHIQQAVRAHWAIENSLHWILDVVFHEDDSRVRSQNAPENMAIIKRMALNQLQLAKPNFRKDLSIKGLRKRAGWDDSTLNTILYA